MTSTGSPSGPKARTSAALSASGRNQCTTLRSTRSSGASAGTSAGIQGPAASTRRFASSVSPADADANAPAVRLPAVDDDPVAHLGAIGPRHVEQRGDAARRQQHAGARLERRRRRRIGDAHRRMAARHLRGAEDLVRQAMRPRAGEGAGDEPSVRRADRQAAGRHQQPRDRCAARAPASPRRRAAPAARRAGARSRPRG